MRKLCCVHSCWTYWSSYFPNSPKIHNRLEECNLFCVLCVLLHFEEWLYLALNYAGIPPNLYHTRKWEKCNWEVRFSSLVDVLLLLLRHFIFTRKMLKESRFGAASTWDDSGFASRDGWKITGWRWGHLLDLGGWIKWIICEFHELINVILANSPTQVISECTVVIASLSSKHPITYMSQTHMGKISV